MGIFVGRADNKNNTRGFTLIELLTALLIAAVLLAVATPSFSEFRLNARMTSAANGLLAAVQQARTEAAKRQQAVSLCALQNPVVGDQPACSGAALDRLDDQGWLVFVDPNRDCARTAADPVVNVTSRAGANDGITTLAVGNCISFGPNGFLVQTDAAVVLCDRRGMRTQGSSGLTYARGIALSRSGGARITRDAAQITTTMGLVCP
jgi:type IV fimbrial biogenesis protein FimT